MLSAFNLAFIGRGARMRVWKYMVLFIFAFTGTCLVAQANVPGWQWATSPMQKIQHTMDLHSTTDQMGNTYCYGYVDQLSVFGDTLMDLVDGFEFLWKLNAVGNTEWVIALDEDIFGVADMDCDGSGNLYILSFNSRIAKISPSGYTLWISAAGGFWTTSGKLRVSADGTCYLAGHFDSSFSFMGTYYQAYGRDVLLAKMTAAGDWVWLRVARSPANDELRDLDIDAAGNCYIGGVAGAAIYFGSISLPFVGHMATVYVAKCTFNGEWSWAHSLYPYVPTYFPGDVTYIAASPGGVCYIGHYEHSSTGMITRVSSVGATGVTGTLYSGTTMRCSGLDTDGAGNIYLLGYFWGTVTLGSETVTADRGSLLAKYNTAGNFSWAVLEALSFIYPVDFRVSSNGSASLTVMLNSENQIGSFICSPSRGGSLYVFKIDTVGTISWMRTNWINTIKSESRAVDICPEGPLSADLCTYVAGVFEGDLYIGNQWLKNSTATGSDIYVAKMTSPGNWVWAASAGGTGIDEVWDISAETGVIYITGSFTGEANFGGNWLASAGESDVFIAAMDLDGNWMWAKRAGGSGMDVGRDIHMKDSVSPAIAGTFSDTAEFGGQNIIGAGGRDAFVCEMNLEGSFESVMSFGGPGNDTGKALFTAGNHIFLAGEFIESFAVGDHVLTSAGGYDIYLVCKSPDGAWPMVLSGGGAADDQVNDIWISSSARFYLTGSFQGTANFGEHTLVSMGMPDVFVLSADMISGWIWASAGGSDGWDGGTAISWDEANDLVITGWTEGNSSFGDYSYPGLGARDILLAALDPFSGEWQWAKHSGTSNDEYGMDLIHDPYGGVVCAGNISSSTYFQEHYVLPHGRYQGFVGKISYSLPNEDPAEIHTPLRIDSVYPNPFNPSTNIKLSLSEPGHLLLEVYNSRGQRVRSLLNEFYPAGDIVVSWDGTDSGAKAVSSGIYFAVATSRENRVLRKLVLIK